MTILTHSWQHGKVTLLTVLHHDVLVERDLVRCKDLLVTARLLLRVHCRARPMVGLGPR